MKGILAVEGLIAPGSLSTFDQLIVSNCEGSK